jgi:hypothetical protein
MPILAVEQPRYLPDLEFFFKMKNADIFVLADSFQYSSHSSINRTRIKTADEPRWLTVPVLTKAKRQQTIAQTLIDRTRNWRRNHWRTIEVNYCMTPYFERHQSFLKTSFHRDWKQIVNLNVHFIKYFSQELLLKTCLKLGSNLSRNTDRTERVVYWLRETACDTYLISKQHRSLIDSEIILKEGFKVRTFEFHNPLYHQQFGDFVPGLSIIDLLCNEGPRSIELLTNTVNI